MNAHTPLTHCRALHGTPRTRALDAMIARADRAPLTKWARTPAQVSPLLPEQAPYFSGPDALAQHLHDTMYAAIPGSALPHHVAYCGAEATINALIALVYARTPDDPLPAMVRILRELQPPLSHQRASHGDRIDAAMEQLERLTEELLTTAGDARDELWALDD